MPSWRRKWLAEQVRLVRLACGCTEDISIRTLTFINSFDGCEIDCVKCGKFSKVLGPARRIKVKLPDTPLF